MLIVPLDIRENLVLIAITRALENGETIGQRRFQRHVDRRAGAPGES